MRQIWLTALSRVPTDAERKTMQQLAKELQTDSAEATQLWQHIAHVVFNHPDFAWLD